MRATLLKFVSSVGSSQYHTLQVTVVVNVCFNCANCDFDCENVTVGYELNIPWVISVHASFSGNDINSISDNHAMQDIFNHESQPVFNLADTGMGTWVLRNKTGSGGVSAHSIGTAIDINPSTGSFFINGSWWGNGYKQKVITAEMWEQLPECHTKYHVLYDGCPIVETFKAYGFCWGGDWTSVKDPMHISFIADGNDARSVGYNNYKERQK